MDENFVTVEIAKKLKEKGFRKPCVATYDDDGMLGYNYYQPKRIHTVSFDDCLCTSDDLVLAPTISQVLKWLREERNLHIVIDITNYGFISSTISFKWDKSYCENEIEHYDHKGYSTYEEAAIAEIEYTLDNLI